VFKLYGPKTIISIFIFLNVIHYRTLIIWGLVTLWKSRWQHQLEATRPHSMTAVFVAYRIHSAIMLADITFKSVGLKAPPTSYLALANPCMRYAWLKVNAITKNEFCQHWFIHTLQKVNINYRGDRELTSN